MQTSITSSLELDELLGSHEMLNYRQLFGMVQYNFKFMCPETIRQTEVNYRKVDYTCNDVDGPGRD